MNASELQCFCADANDIREHITKPWSRGDYTYATNGHIILRVKRLPDVEDDAQAPNAAKLFAITAPESTWLPVPVATMPPMVDCDECKGTGIFTWRDRDGTPDSEDCEWCNHTGKVKQLIGVKVGDASFDQGYLSMIQGWEISLTGRKDAAWIRNGDTIGLLMPRNE